MLLTGASGLLGKAIIELSPAHVSIGAISRNEQNPAKENIVNFQADITDELSVTNIFDSFSPDVVIHAAAEGNVDFVESNREVAKLINVDASRILAENAVKSGAKLIFISSNAVFGNQSTPYSESDLPEPINYYGQLKLEAEKFVLDIAERNLVVRPILMYGWSHPHSRSNPAQTWINSLRNKESISVVTDVSSQPLSVYDCARFLLQSALAEKQGLVHISGKEHVTLNEFAHEVAKIFSLDTSLIRESKLSDFKSLAPRPFDTKYSLDKLESEFNFTPQSLAAGLLEMKRIEGMTIVC